MAERGIVRPGTDWITLVLIVGAYAGWGAALWVPSVWFSVPALAVLIAFHASLTHEVLHGHPFRSRFWSEMTMRLPLNLAIPYCRFRDTHLAHHRDASLTDPYDDPETNYLDPDIWDTLPGWKRALLQFNNTLAGRILIGPALTQWAFMRGDWRLIRGGDRRVLAAWVLHGIGMVPVLWLAALSPTPVWAYLLACYLGLGILRIRTFLEHRAHEKARGRTVVVEDRGPLAWLFLFNSLHAVHHMHPNVAWHRLPALYDSDRERFLRVNDGYVYRSYGQIFREHFLHPKDPVPHPLWRRR